VAILHALDQTFDIHSDESCQGVLAISGWALDTFCQLFCDSHWSLADDEDDERVLLPIVEHDELQELHAAEANQTVIKLKAADTFHCRRDHPLNASLSSPEQMKQQRNWVLDSLIWRFAKQNLQGLELLQSHLQGTSKLDGNVLVRPGGSVPHMAVHIHWLEGSCMSRIDNLPSKDECHMTPSCIKRIFGSQGLLGCIPMVVIADLQQEKNLDALRQDAEIGPPVIIPALDMTIFDSSGTGVGSDMVMATNSAIFARRRASSMSSMIGLLRVTAGADPKSNFIHVGVRADGKLDVCAECIFFCNKTAVPPPPCGARTPFVLAHEPVDIASLMF